MLRNGRKQAPCELHIQVMGEVSIAQGARCMRAARQHAGNDAQTAQGLMQEAEGWLGLRTIVAGKPM
jgi:hypothetical protein